MTTITDDALLEDATSEPAGTWAPISGRWSIEPARVVYQGPDERLGVSFPGGMCLNSKRLTDGELSVKAKLGRSERTTAGIFFGYQSLNRAYAIAALGAYDRGYAISMFLPGSGFFALSEAGSIQNLVPDEEYAIRVSFAAQRIRLTVNNVDVLETVLRSPLEGGGWGLFAWDDASIDFSASEILRTKPKLFVVMPFKEPYDTLYRDVIHPIAADPKLGFEVIRVDEIAGPGIILEDIRRQIDEAHVIVAEVSEQNANVFYELGYAHALNKPAVLLARRRTENGESTILPFDISMFRTIFYDDTIGGKKKVEHELRRHLEAVLRDAR